MHLNIPVFEQLQSCKNLLISGMGGGFDIFCGLPLYFELRDRLPNVHLANYSFSLLPGMTGAQRVSETLYGVNADSHQYVPYFPELYLSQWFREARSEEVTIWCFQKTGVVPLIEAYQALIEHLSIDGILLIDGGVDSLMQGDEPEVGTILEDSISLCAVNELRTVPLRMTAALGFGAEQDMAYGSVFANIAQLAYSGDFLGSCSLIKQMEAYQMYEDALLYVQNKAGQDPSVINSSVVSAVRGHFSNFHLTKKTAGSRLWISPLMPIYWFFNFQAVASHNLLLPSLRYTNTINDVVRATWAALNHAPKRKAEAVRL